MKRFFAILVGVVVVIVCWLAWKKMHSPGGPPGADDWQELQTIIASAKDGDVVTLYRDYVVTDTVVVDKRKLTLRGARTVDTSAIDLRQLDKTTEACITVRLEGYRNVPLFLVGNEPKWKGLCADAVFDVLFPKDSIDCDLRLENLHLVGNNTCSVVEGAANSCDSISELDGWKDNRDLQRRVRAFRSKCLTFPATSANMSDSYTPDDAPYCACKDGNVCPISESKLSEVDQNHDVWSYMCADDTCSRLKDCDMRASFETDFLKSSVVQIVHSSCSINNCCVERGSSAGVGAVMHSQVTIHNSCLRNNRWDGFGPDQLRSGCLRRVFTHGNIGSVSMSKAWLKNTNEPICLRDCRFDDEVGLFVNHYTELTVDSCHFGGVATIGNFGVQQGEVGASVVFVNCTFQSDPPPIKLGPGATLSFFPGKMEVLQGGETSFTPATDCCS